ncbi:hypothetical protein BDN72DRAFT_831351 [Pluteus cervinus]|uniref:Uncharacterized protein n=1 Tax=Pluteus cervinus TaxID=181527 RepID=A0ACD3BE39_9AGAR|nr:hypothetical protein BDN72DRAFT_831351 [Pluteus cervinus]
MLRNATIPRRCVGLLSQPTWVPIRSLADTRTQARYKNREVDATSETLRVPRYLRRAPAPQETQNPTGIKSATSTTTKYRSRHYDPSHEAEKTKKDGEIRLLEPFVLSARLKKLCDAGKVEEAVAMLKNAPLDASNTAVWNTLIWECMKARKFTVAYKLYVDMKRRGFSPSTRTFQTMFSGLSRIEQWNHHTLQLQNARNLYEHYQRHMESLQKHEPGSPDITPIPLTGYIKILGDAGQYQDLFDVYYALEAAGPLSANEFIYSAMFRALATPSNERGPKPFGDVKILWTQMLRASKKTPGFEVDAALVTAAIGAISRTAASQADFALAFQLIHDYFGLNRPEDAPSLSGTVPLTAQALANIFILCNQSGHPEYAIHYFQQLKRRPPAMGDTSLLDQHHMGEILRSHLAASPPDLGQQSLSILEFMLRREITGVNGGEKNGPKIRPTTSTYHLVMLCCWKSSDWESARRVFELMTGYHLEDFGDEAASKADSKWKPRMDKRAAGRNLTPTAETVSGLLRCAVASITTGAGSRGKGQVSSEANLERVRQCLRFVDYMGGVKAVAGRRTMTEAQSQSDTNQMLKNKAFHASKLAIAVKEAVQLLSGSGRAEQSELDEAARWRRLNEEAKSIARSYEQGRPSQSTSDFIPRTSGEAPILKRPPPHPRSPPPTSWKLKSLRGDRDDSGRI